MTTWITEACLTYYDPNDPNKCQRSYYSSHEHLYIVDKVALSMFMRLAVDGVVYGFSYGIINDEEYKLTFGFAHWKRVKWFK